MRILLWLHLVSTAVLIGGGLMTALATVLAHRSRNVVLIAHTAGIVNASELVLTGSAVVVQPVTGLLLAFRFGWPLTSGWLALSIGIYAVVVATWFLALRAQTKLWIASRGADDPARDPPAAYERAYRGWRIWYVLTLAGLLAVTWLMAAKPVLGGIVSASMMR